MLSMSAQSGGLMLSAEKRPLLTATSFSMSSSHMATNLSRLPPLNISDQVMIQDQAAAKQPGKWTKTGKVIENQGFDLYLIKVDGGNRVTKRNRRFLRRIVPFIHR